MKTEPEKNSGLNGIRTHDLCDAGAVLYQLSYQANWELKYDKLPVGLIAQLVEHCNGIAEVMCLNPIQAWIFSGFLLTTALRTNCEDLSSI